MSCELNKKYTVYKKYNCIKHKKNSKKYVTIRRITLPFSNFLEFSFCTRILVVLVPNISCNRSSNRLYLISDRNYWLLFGSLGPAAESTLQTITCVHNVIAKLKNL